VPAVVGSFPEPFIHGPGSVKRLPVRVECVEIESAPCRQISKTLAAFGVPVATGLFRASITKATLRLLVGPWEALREDDTLRQLESGPSVSGVYAQPSSTGSQINLLNADARTVLSLGAGSGLIAATGLKLIPALRNNAMGRPACAAAGIVSFVVITQLHLPLVWVLLGLGIPAGVWAWFRLGRA